VAGSPALLLFSIGSGSANIGMPHADSQCNYVIIGFMVAQFIAEFRHQASPPSTTSPRLGGTRHLLHPGPWPGPVQAEAWRCGGGAGEGLGRKFPRPASSFSSASRRNLAEVELEEAAAPELGRRESTSTVCTGSAGRA